MSGQLSSVVKQVSLNTRARTYAHIFSHMCTYAHTPTHKPTRIDFHSNVNLTSEASSFSSAIAYDKILFCISLGSTYVACSFRIHSVIISFPIIIGRIMTLDCLVIGEVHLNLGS